MIFFKEYLVNKYNKPLYRISIDLPLSCPHRVKGGGKGCLFCPEDGARARHLKNNLDLQSQVKSGIEYVKKRYGDDIGLIAYFQSFTNTNASVERLREYYSEVLSYAKFDMIIISTRPDSLPDEVVEYLSELNEQYELWIELGVQSSNDKTLQLINRQHDFQSVKDGVAKLVKKNIRVAAHVILGLPGEDICDYRRTAKELALLPFSGIKVHNLLILKNTPLAKIYHKQKNNIPVEYPEIKPLNEYEYSDALIDFLQYIPDSWPLMRVTTDAPPKDIIAPRWWMKKGQFIENFRDRMNNPTETHMGDKFSDNYIGTISKVKTEDGSYTLYHPEYKQYFHSLAGADRESLKKFIEPSDIINQLQKGKNLKILDIGFGLGKNALAVIDAAKQNYDLNSTGGVNSTMVASKSFIHSDIGLNDKKIVNNIEKEKFINVCEVISLEKDEKTLEMAYKLNLDSNILKTIYEKQYWSSDYASLKLLVGDARELVIKLDVNKKFDAIFLDPFSHEVNPELWTFDFIAKLAELLKDDGVIVTYSAAFPIRGAMLKCNLNIGETASFGRKKGGTIASFLKNKILSPISEKEVNILTKSTAGTPYRDRSLKKPINSSLSLVNESHLLNSRNDIRDYRHKLVRKLQSIGVPKWWKFDVEIGKF